VGFYGDRMHFEFWVPVYVGDTITTTAEVIEAIQEKGYVRLQIEVKPRGKRPSCVVNIWLSRPARGVNRYAARLAIEQLGLHGVKMPGVWSRIQSPAG